MKTNKTFNTIILLIGLGLVSGAHAKTFTFEINNPVGSAGSDAAGDITYFQTSYDSSSEELSWRSTISEAKGKLADAFWLVLSDGPDPMVDRNEYAIFYGDSSSGNLSAYVYNGLNSGSSWNTPGEFIQTFGDPFESDSSIAGEVTFSFAIDASFINSYQPTTPGINDWDGAQFGEKIGIWYHPVVLANASSYNADGSLSSFPEIVSGFFDTFNQTTTVTVPNVPESGTLALASIGLIGMIVGRRRRK